MREKSFVPSFTTVSPRSNGSRAYIEPPGK
jgi:hypothetical protein